MLGPYPPRARQHHPFPARDWLAWAVTQVTVLVSLFHCFFVQSCTYGRNLLANSFNWISQMTGRQHFFSSFFLFFCFLWPWTFNVFQRLNDLMMSFFFERDTNWTLKKQLNSFFFPPTKQRFPLTKQRFPLWTPPSPFFCYNNWFEHSGPGTRIIMLLILLSLHASIPERVFITTSIYHSSNRPTSICFSECLRSVVFVNFVLLSFGRRTCSTSCFAFKG